MKNEKMARLTGFEYQYGCGIFTVTYQDDSFINEDDYTEKGFITMINHKISNEIDIILDKSEQIEILCDLIEDINNDCTKCSCGAWEYKKNLETCFDCNDYICPSCRIYGNHNEEYYCEDCYYNE